MDDDKECQQIKQDALALAELIYEVFKERQASGKLDIGQNNAN